MVTTRPGRAVTSCRPQHFGTDHFGQQQVRAGAFVPAIMATHDRAWFANFDGMTAEIDELHDITDRIAASHAIVEKTREWHKRETAAREKSDNFIKEQVDRIELVNSHWFFGSNMLQPQLWMRGGTQGKISRAQVKLDAARAAHPALVEAERLVREEKLPAHEEAERKLIALGERRIRLQGEREELRRAAIIAHPSEAMPMLQEQISREGTAVLETCDGADGLKKGGELCCKAVFHYTKAVKGAREARAAEKEAEAVVSAYASRHVPSELKREPAETAAQREAMREAALAEMASRADTLRTTIAETSAGADALKILVGACAKAKSGYEQAAKMTTEANDAERDSESTMRPADAAEARYGAAPAPVAGAEAAAERQGALEHLREQQGLLQATIQETSEGAAALKQAAGLCKSARAALDRSMGELTGFQPAPLASRLHRLAFLASSDDSGARPFESHSRSLRQLGARCGGVGECRHGRGHANNGGGPVRGGGDHAQLSAQVAGHCQGK